MRTPSACVRQKSQYKILLTSFRLRNNPIDFYHYSDMDDCFIWFGTFLVLDSGQTKEHENVDFPKGVSSVPDSTSRSKYESTQQADCTGTERLAEI